MENPNKRPTAADYFSQSEEETIALAKRLAINFRGDEIVLLSGDLGAGKTVFTKGIAAGLDIEDISQVHSPSYTLINIYQTKYPLYHIDLFRLESQTEIDGLGWEDFLGEGVIVFEWGEKMMFSGEAISVRLETVEVSGRKIRLSTDSPHLASLFPGNI